MILQISELMQAAGAESMTLTVQRDASGNLTVVTNTVLGAAPDTTESQALRQGLAMPLVVRGSAADVAQAFAGQLAQYAQTVEPLWKRYNSLGKVESAVAEAGDKADKAKPASKTTKPAAAKNEQAATVPADDETANVSSEQNAPANNDNLDFFDAEEVDSL